MNVQEDRSRFTVAGGFVWHDGYYWVYRDDKGDHVLGARDAADAIEQAKHLGAEHDSCPRCGRVVLPGDVPVTVDEQTHLYHSHCWEALADELNPARRL